MSGEIKKSTSYRLYENRLYEHIGYSNASIPNNVIRCK